MAKLSKSMTDAVTVGPIDGQVVQQAKSNNPAGPETFRVLVQLYLHGRSAIVQDYGQFIRFIEEQLGCRAGDWEFDRREPPRLENPDGEFPVVQACLQFLPNEGGGDDAIHNLRSMIKKGSTLQYPGEGSTPVLLLCHKINSPGNYTLVTGECFSGFNWTWGSAWTERGQGFASTDRSPTVDALKDVAYNIGGVVMLVDSAYKAANSIWNSIRNEPSPSSQASSKPPYPQPNFRALGDEDHGAILGRLSSLMNPSWKHDRMRNLARRRQKLPGTSKKLKYSFRGPDNWAKSLTSEDAGDVSIARTLHLAQLFSEMSSSMETTINEANELISLHSTEYTQEKRNVHGLFAASGCVVFVGIALLSPWGWPAIWAAGSTWVKLNVAAAGGIAATGAVTTGLCGYHAKTNHEQYTLRRTLKGKMEVAYAGLELSKRRLLVVMIFLIFGSNTEAGELRSQLCTKACVDIEDVLKVGKAQPDSNGHVEYRKSILKDAWKQFQEHFEKYHQSAAELSKLG